MKVMVRGVGGGNERRIIETDHIEWILPFIMREKFSPALIEYEGDSAERKAIEELIKAHHEEIYRDPRFDKIQGPGMGKIMLHEGNATVIDAEKISK